MQKSQAKECHKIIFTEKNIKQTYAYIPNGGILILKQLSNLWHYNELRSNMYETGGWEVASKLKYLFLGVCMYPF